MRNVVLFIAMSLDGYIADSGGGVDWLRGQDSGQGEPDSYDRFAREIDTVLMGWNTYHQIVTELSPAEWVYQDFTTYVFTHRRDHGKPPSGRILFTEEDPAALVGRLKAEEGKDLWVCGGADLVRQLLREDLIDRFHISVIPTLLGSGIRLFDPMPQGVDLRLVRTTVCNGIAELVYTRRAQRAGGNAFLS